jgi:hypothetical protein
VLVEEEESLDTTGNGKEASGLLLFIKVKSTEKQCISLSGNVTALQIAPCGSDNKLLCSRSNVSPFMVYCAAP